MILISIPLVGNFSCLAQRATLEYCVHCYCSFHSCLWFLFHKNIDKMMYNSYTNIHVNKGYYLLTLKILLCLIRIWRWWILRYELLSGPNVELSEINLANRILATQIYLAYFTLECSQTEPGYGLKCFFTVTRGIGELWSMNEARNIPDQDT